MFKKKPCVFNQVEEYALWKAERAPFIAGAQRSLLLRFAREVKVDSVSEITAASVAYLIAGKDSAYESQCLLVALRGFLRYARWAGYPCIHYTHLTQRSLMALKKGPKVDMKRVEVIKEMRSRGIPYRKIVEELGKTSKKPVYLSGVVRWAKIVIPT